MENNSFNLQNDLEIILITYNRKSFLQSTLENIFSEASPIKDLQITILDNKSTDGSTELIQEYACKYSNINHIIHKKNIGGNANIARAIEIAEKKYFWVICDDDDFNWSNWKEIEDALKNDYDVVFTETSNFKNYKNDASIFRAATFLPSTIYKTELVNNDVMQAATLNLSNMFPHLPIMAYALNEGKTIFIPDKGVIEVGNRETGSNESVFTRGCECFIHPRFKEMFLIVGYINSVQMIKDKKRRAFILDHMSCKNTGFFREIAANFKRNRIYYNNSFRNICDVFCGLNFSQKLQFLAALVWLDIIYFVKKFILRKIK